MLQQKFKINILTENSTSVKTVNSVKQIASCIGSKLLVCLRENKHSENQWVLVHSDGQMLPFL